jgi:hypothetical protein
MNDKAYVNCTECNKELELHINDYITDDIQCSTECAIQSWNESPSSCVECNCDLTDYYQYVNNNGMCDFCYRDAFEEPF